MRAEFCALADLYHCTVLSSCKFGPPGHHVQSLYKLLQVALNLTWSCTTQTQPFWLWNLGAGWVICHWPITYTSHRDSQAVLVPIAAARDRHGEKKNTGIVALMQWPCKESVPQLPVWLQSSGWLQFCIGHSRHGCSAKELDTLESATPAIGSHVYACLRARTDACRHLTRINIPQSRNAATKDLDFRIECTASILTWDIKRYPGEHHRVTPFASSVIK